MEQKDFEKKMNELKTPEVENITHYRELKLMLVGAKKSAALGFWFVVIPCYFLFCVFMKYYFHVNLHLFDVFIEMIADLDKTPGMKFVSPFLFVGLPLVGIVMNVLSIVFVEYEKSWKEVKLTIKIRWLNIIVIAISAVIVCIFILYALIENFYHGALPSYQ